MTYCILYKEVIKIFDEKIKIRISGFLRHTLELDAMCFNFVKKGEFPNLNSFLNKLIPNLLKLKKERREKAKVRLSDIVEFKSERMGYEELVAALNASYDEVYFSDAELEQLDQVIWIRPTKENIVVFDEIFDNETMLTGLDKSTYIRNMLNEYSRFPRYKKEQIVFSEESDITLEARDSGRILKFRYENDKHKAYVFGCVYNYLEEQGNYILCYDLSINAICRFQLCEIDYLHLLEKKYIPDSNLIEMCDKYIDEALWMDDEIISLDEVNDEK